MTLPLYRRLLGVRFDALPARVRELHDLTGPATWIGRADVERGTSWAARAAAGLFSLPPAGPDQPLSVAFEPVDGRETWTRAFGTNVFRSLQYERGGRLFERVGPSSLGFVFDASPNGLSLVLTDVRLLGVPLPRWLHPNVRTLESERDGRYRFEVEARMPGVGLLVRYAGWLERTAPQQVSGVRGQGTRPFPIP
jgi:hypothetical protein